MDFGLIILGNLLCLWDLWIIGNYGTMFCIMIQAGSLDLVLMHVDVLQVIHAF